MIGDPYRWDWMRQRYSLPTPAEAEADRQIEELQTEIVQFAQSDLGQLASCPGICQLCTLNGRINECQTGRKMLELYARSTWRTAPKRYAYGGHQQ